MKVIVLGIAIALSAIVFGILIGRAADFESRSQYPGNCIVFEDDSARCSSDR